jgi:hypothetical protein
MSHVNTSERAQTHGEEMARRIEGFLLQLKQDGGHR